MRSDRLAVVTLLYLAAACANQAPTAPSDSPDRPSLAVTHAAPFLPGEQQSTADPKSGTWALYPNGAGQNLSQTFKPRSNQQLGYLELPVGCSAGVLLNVKIRDGLAGPIMYETNVSGLPAVVDGTFQLIQVYNPAVGPLHLRKNHAYAFELAAFPGPGAVETTCGLAKGPVGDSYPRGSGFYSDPIAGWLHLPNGLATDEQDLPFITLVR